ncbi:MAG: hypothetical protein DCC88_02940 [Spirobacillus cienkowskii]|jgi:hypothetical protein|uniref:Uncharacterized protein n=1 Tax=Spirobacillus cienkowskii TaxID=495820 RepID=A0A369KYQ2_9BACT|nr:MAG: hypothetical protein DCC88_02940 [Spirobacillus cienkowskii]
MQQKNKKKLILFLLLSVFIILCSLIVKSIIINPDLQETELDKEAKKASLSDRLRAQSLENVELGKAKISDISENDSLINQSKDEQQSTSLYTDNNNDNYNLKVFDEYRERDAESFGELISKISDAVIHKIKEKNFDIHAQHQAQMIDSPKQSSKFSRLTAMSSQKLQTISGVEQVAGRTQMFKAGTRVYAILPDKLTVSSSESIDTSLIAFGSTEQKFPNHITFVGKAQLNKSQRRVEILIDKCVNTRDDSPHLPCTAIVKDILGDNGLSGKIYDPSNWQLIVSTASTFLTTYVLSSLTTSTTQTGITVDQSIANQVRQALSGSINAVAGRINDNLTRNGKEITISSGSIVQVFFVETTNAWNLK